MSEENSSPTSDTRNEIVNLNGESGLAVQQPTESLLAFFTPEGWGSAVQAAGLTAADEARILADIARDPAVDPKCRMDALDRYRARHEAALRYARVFGDGQVDVTVSRASVKVSLPDTKRTELLLSQAVAGMLPSQAPQTIDVEPEDPQTNVD